MYFIHMVEVAYKWNKFTVLNKSLFLTIFTTQYLTAVKGCRFPLWPAMSCNKLCVQAMSNTCITTRALREQIHTRHSHCLRRHCRLIPRQQSGGLSKNTSCRIFLEDTNRSCATVRRWMSSSPLPRQGGGVVNIFDRQAKRKQKNRAALAEDAATYDYLRDEVSSMPKRKILLYNPALYVIMQ